MANAMKKIRKLNEKYHNIRLLLQKKIEYNVFQYFFMLLIPRIQ